MSMVEADRAALPTASEGGTMLARHENNFGALRLFFAMLVRVSHAAELKDDDRSREILTRIFGTISFGELAVNGFFLISGYLITASFIRSPVPAQFIRNRVLRIYPGFLVVCLLSYCVSPLFGGNLADVDLLKAALNLALLLPPEVRGVFAGNHYGELNAPLWTIAYEFRCYALVLVLGITGVLRWRSLIVGVALVGLWASAAQIPLPTAHATPLLGIPLHNLHFVPIFLSGVSFYLYRDRIAYRGDLAAAAAVILLIAMFSPAAAVPSVAIFGGYLIFWFAFTVKSPALAKIGRRNDYSYGVYLYAWPVQSWFVWIDFPNSPWVALVVAAPIVGLLAYGSWHLVEKPAMALKNKRLFS